MGSSLAPILASLFMGFNEKQWLSNYKDSQVLFHRRYVDDAFVYFSFKDPFPEALKASVAY